MEILPPFERSLGHCITPIVGRKGEVIRFMGVNRESRLEAVGVMKWPGTRGEAMAEMTVRNARKLLAASPLTFGDEEQIRAVRLIEMAEEYRDLVECSDAGHEDCPECDGSGETECLTCGHEEACDVCDGTGEVSSLPIEVSGISLATAPELFAAIEKFKSIISAAA